MSHEQHQCCGHDDGSKMLPVNDGLQRILARIEPLRHYEILDLRNAQGRILANDVISPIDVPAYNNSAMDGYAVNSADLDENAEQQFRVVANVLAGHPFQGQLKTGDAVQIMTGAPVPEGLDTVIMREICQREGDSVRFPAGAKAGQNRRMAGEDLKRGSAAILAGTRLDAAELGMIASLGQSEVKVVRRPRVAYFSTGDEIRSLGQPLEAGQIYDSNRYTVTALLRRLGIQVIDLGVIPDQREAIEQAFREAAAQADVVLSSGGVSLGDADYVKETLERLGLVDFWKLAIKPGRPLAVGEIEGAHFFGLPGNPVAVMITYLLFVLPALRKLEGETHHLPLRVQAKASEAMRKKPGRTEYVRGVLSRSAEGETFVKTTGHQGSGLLTSMSQANCLIELEQPRGNIAAGETVTLLPFSGLI